MDFFKGVQQRLRENRKSNGEAKFAWTYFLFTYYSYSTSILEETVSKMYGPLEVLWVQSARMCLQINVKKTK